MLIAFIFIPPRELLLGLAYREMCVHEEILYHEKQKPRIPTKGNNGNSRREEILGRCLFGRCYAYMASVTCCWLGSNNSRKQWATVYKTINHNSKPFRTLMKPNDSICCGHCSMFTSWLGERGDSAVMGPLTATLANSRKCPAWMQWTLSQSHS